MINFKLPELKTVKKFELENDEVFILAAGFEERVEAFSSHMSVKGDAKAVILEYLPFDIRNKVKLVEKLLVDSGIDLERHERIIYNRMQPNGFARNLTAMLEKLQPSKVTIDISAMSKLAVLLCMSVCEDLDLALRIYYCEASTYGPLESEFQRAQNEGMIGQPTMSVFTGIEDVHQVRRFSSVSMHGHPAAIFAFMSFNEKFIQVLLNRISPSHLFMINGKPPEHCWREKATAWIHERLLDEWSRDNLIKDNLPDRATSTLDYRETVNSLSSLYWDVATRCRIILAPTGSKMQTVGCFIFRQAHRDVHIEYPAAQGFSDEYSEGVGDAWIVDFGHIKSLVKEFSQHDRSCNLFS